MSITDFDSDSDSEVRACEQHGKYEGVAQNMRRDVDI